jgi:hypothetical protein
MADDISKLLDDSQDQDNSSYSGKLQDYEKYLDLLKKKPVPTPTPSQSDVNAQDDEEDDQDDSAPGPGNTDSSNNVKPINLGSMNSSKNPFAASIVQPKEDTEDMETSDDSDEEEPVQLSVPSSNSLSSIQNLLKAQGLANENIFGTQLMSSLDRLGAGIARTQPVAQEAYKEQMKLAGVPVQQFQQASEFEKNDPSSDISNSFRDILKDKFKVDVGSNVSAADIEKIAPWVVKATELQQSKQISQANRQGQLAEQKRHNLELESLGKTNADIKQQKVDNSADTGDQNQQDKLDKEQRAAQADVSRQLQQARGRKDLQNAREVVRLSDIVSDIYKKYPNLNDMPQQEVNLITRDIDRIFSGGVSSEAGFKEIAPSSKFSELKQGLSRVLNRPTGSELGQFLQLYSNDLNNIKNKSENYLGEHASEVLETNKSRLTPQAYDDFIKNTRVLQVLPKYQQYMLQKHLTNNLTPESDMYNKPLTIRRKSDGKTKIIPASQANQFLKDPDFELVQ